MSKKIAAGADAIVLDVKCGSGAFMKTPEEARVLAQTMVDIGQNLNRKVIALIGDMDQPLGHAIGNALEVKEAIETLHGHGPADFTEHCLVVAVAHAASGRESPIGGRRPRAGGEVAGRRIGLSQIPRTRAGAGRRCASMVDQPERLPHASIVRAVKADRAGYVQRINALEVGLTSVDLGAGRAKKGDPIDYAVGILLHAKVADRVEAGQTAVYHPRQRSRQGRCRRRTPAPRHHHRRRSGEAAAVVLWDCELIRNRVSPS